MKIVQRVERLLSSLHSATPQVGTTSRSTASSAPLAYDPKALAKELSTIVLGDVVESERAATTATLFDASSGLLAWLATAVHYTAKGYYEAKKEVLTLLAAYVEAHGHSIQEHVLAIKDSATSLFRRDASNQVRTAALSVFLAIFNLRLPYLDSSTLGLQDLTHKLLDDLTGSATGKSDGLIGGILHVLGVIAERFPSIITPHADHLLSIYISTTRKHFEAASPKFTILTGALEGLTSFYVSFAPILDARAEAKALLFRHISTYGVFIPSDKKRTKLGVPRAALAFLARHAPAFSPYILENPIKLYKRLVTLSAHQNKHLSKLAFAALDAFVNVITDDLGAGPADSRLGNSGFAAFLQGFLAIMDATTHASMDELSFAVRSAGKMGAVLAPFASAPNEVDKLLNKIVDLAGKLVDSSRPQEFLISLLPSFLWAFASILPAVTEVHPLLLAEFERILGVALLLFPKLWPTQRKTFVLAVSSLFLALYYKGAPLSSLLDGFVYHGLWLTCSSRAALAALTSALATTTAPSTPSSFSVSSYASKIASSEETELYTEYYQLWAALLSPTLTSPASLEDVRTLLPAWSSAVGPLFAAPIPDVAAMQTELYDAILNSMMKMFKTLVVSFELPSTTTTATTTTPGSDPSDDDPSSLSDVSILNLARGLRPSNAKDYEIFLYLVDFAQLFLPSVMPDASSRWFYVFGSVLVECSENHHSVSGYYKILGLLFVNMEVTNYFGSASVQSVIHAQQQQQPSGSGGSGGPSGPGASTDAAFTLFYKFVQNLVVRLKQYTGDLLAAAVACVLSVPHQLVELNRLLPPLQTALRLGLGFSPLALTGMDALERWAALPGLDLSSVYPAILPLLNPYLNIKAVAADARVADLTEDAASIVKSRSSEGSAALNLRRSSAKESSRVSMIAAPNQSISIAALQLRILNFLGAIAGDNHALVLPPASALAASSSSSSSSSSAPALETSASGSSSSEPGSVMRWDSVSRILFEFPFRDVKIDVHLDTLLPRLAELAEHGADRQAKVAAAEALHSIVLHMIGSDAKSTVSRDYSILYTHLFPVLLRLAADVDAFTRNLFYPLVLQLIHWFTSSAPAADDTLALLDAVVSAVCSPSSHLRELAAQYMAEFLKWAIKQSGSSGSSSSSSSVSDKLSVRALLRHIFALAAHPSPFRRIGAADAYLAIYRLFREEPDLVSFYVLEMLRNVFVSLKLAASDPEGLGTQSKMKRVLTALCRIISYFSESLNAPHVSPSNEPRLGFDTLDDALMFLFQSTTSLHMSVCHAAIEALEALVPNTAKYLAKSGCAGLALFAHAESHLVAHSQQGGSVIPTPTKYFTLDALTSFHAFAARLTAALDGYIWILSSAMASVSDLSLDSSTSPLTALATLPEFLPALLDPPLALAAKQSPEAVASLRSTTTLLLVKMFVFVARVLETCESDTSPGMALLSHLGVLSPNSAFLRLLLVATLAPAALGFAVGNAEIRTQLPKVTQHLLILLSSLLARSTSTSSSSSSPLGLLVTAVQALFTDHPEYAILSNTPTHLTPPKEEEAFEFTATLIAGYKQLAKANLLEPVLSLSRDALTALLLDHAQEAARVAASSGTHEASPLQKLLNEAKVNLALSLDVAPGEVLARLTAQDPVAIFSAGAETDVDIAAMEIAQAEATLGSQRMSQLTPASLAMSLPSASQSQSQSQSQQQPSPPAPSMMKTSSTRISTLGEVFYSTYRDLVSEHMVSSPGSFIEPLTKATASQPHLMDALLTMLKALMTSRSLAAAHGRPFVTALLTHLPLLSQWWSPVDATPAHHRDSILSLLSHVLRLQVPALLDLRPGGPHEFAVPMLVTAFASLLDLNLPMRFRIRVLAPFPLLLKHLGPYPTQTIMPLLGALNTMVVNNFPMNSKELDRFSPAFTQYIAALDALLAALRVTGSIDLLEILLPVFQEVDHVHTHAIVETSAAMVSHLPHQAVADLFHYAFNLFRDATHPEQLRLAIVRTFCVPILEAGSLTLVSSLATRVIGNLMGIIVAPVAARQKALPGADLSILFCEATCAFNMVQVLFERLNLVFIKHNLNGAFLDSPAAPVPKPETFTGTELIKAILRSAHDAKVEAFSGLADDRSKQLRLEYHRAAYAAMVTVVMRTQEKEAVFTNFLFKENAGKGSFIWENIVDLDVTHAFEAQTSFRTVQARGTFATFTQSRSKSRRRAYRESTERYFHDSSLLSADPTGLFFLNPSQRIDSSLMPDDGEHEVPMEVEGGGGETEAGTTTGAEAEEEEEEESQPTQVKSQQGDNDWYELDTINSNTCMPLLLQLLDHLKKHFVDSFRTAPDASAPAAAFVAAMPKWMKMMWEKVRSPSTHGNVRLFLIKMILSEVSSTSPLSPCPRPRSTLGASSTRRRPKGTSP